MERAGIVSIEECAQELKESRIKRDYNDFSKLLQIIDSTMNPFLDVFGEQDLYSIGSGKTVSNNIAAELPDIYATGLKWYKAFKSECIQDNSRFEKPIKRNKVKNFAADGVDVKITSKQGKKVYELKSSRDLIGRLLYLAVTDDIDLREIFTYPLTPVPLSLGNFDGSMNKTPKSSLLKMLETKVETTNPANIDVLVIDVMFLVREMGNLPMNFQGISEKILTAVCNTKGGEIHIVSDRYHIGSIKGMQQDLRAKRTGGHGKFRITGGDQCRPRYFASALSYSSFKMGLLSFLTNQWGNDSYKTFLKQKILYFGFKDLAYCYSVVDGCIRKTEVNALKSKHIEADTRIVQHLKFAANHRQNINVVVRADDTDILIILLYYSSTTTNEVNLYMELGHSSKNTRRFIDVSGLHKSVGVLICTALPGFHAISGCDYSPTFKEKGKIRPFNIMAKNPKYANAMALLSTDAFDFEAAVIIEAFLCQIYGHKLESVNEVRYKLINEKYKPGNKNMPLTKLTGLDESLFPPCYSALKEQINRAHYVATLWKNAGQEILTDLKPEENGWILENKGYKIFWYEGEMVPAQMVNSMRNIDEKNDEEEESDGYSECETDSEISDYDSEGELYKY